MQVQQVQDDASEAVLQLTTAQGKDKYDLQQCSCLIFPLYTHTLRNASVQHYTDDVMTFESQLASTSELT